MFIKHAFIIFLCINAVVFSDYDNKGYSFSDSIQCSSCNNYSCAASTYSDLGNDTEIRVGYFYPTSHRFRKIFRGARLDYEIETVQAFHRHFAVWANVSWFPKSGHSIGEQDRTTVNLVPLCIGLKYIAWVNCWTRFRFGAGPSYFFLNTSDHGCACGGKHPSYSNFGGVIKSDISHFFSCNLYLSLFFDYLYLPVHSSGIHDASGVKTGLGLGYHF